MLCVCHISLQYKTVLFACLLSDWGQHNGSIASPQIQNVALSVFLKGTVTRYCFLS